MIRVLHTLHSMNRGGAENAIMNYYRHIDREKIQFDFLLTASNPCDFEDEITNLGGHIFRIPELTLSRPWHYINAINAFFKRNPEYRIVHAHTSSKSAVPLAIAKSNHIPIRIAHSHNTRSESGFRGIVRDVLKLPLKHYATHFLSCGIEAAKWLYGKDAYASGKVTLFPNVIEAKRFDFSPNIRTKIRHALNIQSGTTVIGCTARFNNQKNIPFAIDVFEKIAQKNPDSILMLIGDGELRPMIIAKINQLNLQDKVIMTGVVSNVYEYEQAMDIYLMPSLFEGLPLSVVEAQISGLRCYVSTGVPIEVDKTGLVSFISLDKSPSYWADEILHSIHYQRQSHLSDIRSAGYDAETSAINLQQFYIDNYNKHAQN